jgi:hypothetical protein
MHRIAKTLSFPLVALLFTTCDGGSTGPRASVADVAHEFAKAGGVAPAARSQQADQRSDDRMLVQRGELGIEVARPSEAARAFLVRVKELGGHLAKQSGTTLVVRMPAAQFDAVFAAACELGRVVRESREANDVTEEFLDLGIRLETARKARDRLLEVLQKAERIEDILKVEAELRRLTEEIERMEGRRKFLADQVALATLEVAFQGPVEAPPPERRLRQGNRFAWINQIGAEALMEQF